MTLEELDRWFHAYGRAWERKDVDAFVDCFTEDAAYALGAQRGEHDEQRTGRT